jgi:hypothetical protein
MNGLYREHPPYIPVEEITATPPNYDWDSDSPFSLIAPADIDTVRKLKSLSNRGLLVYSIGCAEWVLYRMSKVLDDLLPYFYLEAFWGYVMGHQDLFEYPPELEHDQWLSEERSPIDCAISSIMNVIYLSMYYNPPCNDAARIAQLARHVLASERSFSAWERGVLERLNRFCGRVTHDPEGKPVARQLLDLSLEYDSAASERLIQMDVTGRDFSGNPFSVQRI